MEHGTHLGGAMTHPMNTRFVNVVLRLWVHQPRHGRFIFTYQTTVGVFHFRGSHDCNVSKKCTIAVISLANQHRIGWRSYRDNTRLLDGRNRREWNIFCGSRPPEGAQRGDYVDFFPRAFPFGALLVAFLPPALRN